MSECRICFGKIQGQPLAPCRCKGSIQYVHDKCLMKWLQSKNPGSYQTLLRDSGTGSTGLRCELCKYEYKGKIKLLSFKRILKRIKNSNATYCVLMNIPIILYLGYKCNTLIRHIFWIIYEHVLFTRDKEKISIKIMRFFELYIKLCAKVIPLSVYSFVLPLIIFNTIKMVLKLTGEFKAIQFEEFII